MRFAVISDLHFPSRAARAAAFVKAVRSDPTIEFVVTTGDLTDNGYDGHTTCSCLAPLLGTNNVIVGGSAENQLQEYIKNFDAPLRASGKTVYAVPGNHDQYNGARRYPVNDFLRERHGATHYLVVRGGVALAFCDVYPNASVLEWLTSALNADDARDKPILIFFHYNLMGSFSDWWSQNEKDAFCNAIRGRRVLGIFEGHLHQTYSYRWNGYDVTCTAGDNGWAIVDVNSDVVNVAISS